MTKRWALVSVFYKDGVLDFCRKLAEAGYGILSTGGTAKHLLEAGLPVTMVEEYTGFPEMMDGRVKTLHPRIHGGLLGIRDDAGHMASMEEHGIRQIDVVVVNLYPFQETIAKPDCTFAEAIEKIDIGGPSMLRSAAKNHKYVLPVIDPADYSWLGDALSSGRAITESERIGLAAKVFRVTSEYDAAISAYLARATSGEGGETGQAASGSATGSTAGLTVVSADSAADAEIRLFGTRYTLRQSLRYGENPHQGAAFYAADNASPATLGGAKQLQGKELSYNNIQDADAALSILRGLDSFGCACVAVKHMNPCGVGLGETADEAFARAYEADPVSIFGGIIAFNRPVGADVAAKLTDMFLEIVMAPAFSDEALALFAKKKNVRLLVIDVNEPIWHPGDQLVKRVSGGLLVQEVNFSPATQWQVVTKRQPTPEEYKAMEFGWSIVKYVKSNAIVLATANMTLGIGAGQMNRVGAAKIALEQAGDKASMGVLASDAFFPMRDTVDTAAAAGVKAIVQPGGSIKDKDSIAACDEHGIAMVFTGVRHFLH